MTRKFRLQEWLDDDRHFQVASLSENFMTTIAITPLNATWLEWFLQHGWEMTYCVRSNARPHNGWDCCYVTAFRKVKP